MNNMQNIKMNDSDKIQSIFTREAENGFTNEEMK